MRVVYTFDNFRPLVEKQQQFAKVKKRMLNKQLPFMLTPLEISLSLVAGSLAWFLLYASISNAQPWGWYGG